MRIALQWCKGVPPYTPEWVNETGMSFRINETLEERTRESVHFDEERTQEVI